MRTKTIILTVTFEDLILKLIGLKLKIYWKTNDRNDFFIRDTVMEDMTVEVMTIIKLGRCARFASNTMCITHYDLE